MMPEVRTAAQVPQDSITGKSNPIRVLFRQCRDLWRYRELMQELFKTHLKIRHVGSVLGFIWTMLNPMLHIATYWFVFSYVIKMGLPNYPLFLIPGYLAWNFTFGTLLTASESIIQSKYLITKVAFPSEILPLTSVAVNLFDFLISLVLYLAVVFFLPERIPGAVIFLPLILMIQVVLTIGLSLVVASWSVYFRDIPKLVQVFGTLFFFLTPIFYPLSIIPEKFQGIIALNPMARIVNFYHEILYEGNWPSLEDVAVSVITALLALLVGMLLFNRLKPNFAELS